MVPLTPEKIELGAALLKEGGYRSACLYLATMKRLHVQAGYAWNDQLGLEMADAKRAVQRGRGPDRQADPLPLNAIGKLTEAEVDAARRDYWPAAGRDAAIICCAWLCREVEASTAFASAVTIRPGPDGEGDCASWNMPASKADWLALGKVRTHGCACPSPLCPVCAAKRVVEAAKKENEGREQDARGGPLLPKRGGAPMTKSEMVLFFKDLEAATGKPGRRITGHSGRVTGAMRMAIAGVPLVKIKVFGRWGSAAVERYVRDAILGRLGGGISKVTEGVAKAKAKTGKEKAKAVEEQPEVKEPEKRSREGRRLRRASVED